MKETSFSKSRYEQIARVLFIMASVIIIYRAGYDFGQWLYRTGY